MHHLTAVDMKPQRELDWTVNCSPASSLVRNLCNVGLHMCVNSGGNSAAKTSRVDTFLTLHHVRN